MSEQEVLFFDEYGTIVPDGIDDPGYVTDCMAWGILDDKSGRWHATGVPPPREYFNCLRYLNWIAAGSPPGVVDTRQIPLKEMNDYPTEHHQMAVNCAYGMWADEFFARVPPFGSSSSRFPPMMGPIDLSPHKYNYTEHSPTSRFMSSPDTSSDSQGGIALTSLESSRSTGNWRRTDSVAQSIVSSDTSPVLTWRKGDDKSGSSSPLSRRSTRGSQLSATAPVFQPPVNLALSSGAALPQPPGKIPGTFDVLAQMAQFSVIVVNEAPFNVTINEILTHLKLGEREGIVNYGLDNPAIHIIQDRADSKTHEVYIEMLSYEAAERVIHDIPRRGLKVGSTGGSRKIRVQTTTREKMMQAIFPRPFRNHRELKWLVDTPNPNTMPQSFIGYLTSEDLHNARDWAEHPRKVRKTASFLLSDLSSTVLTSSAG